jgi:phage baseplate assembly protein W
MPYKKTQINSAEGSDQRTSKQSHFYKGFSTVDEQSSSVKLFDYELIKQDLLNHFNTRKGERLMNPTYGTTIWDSLFEPLTPAVKQQISDDINRILASDPRIIPVQVDLTQADYGFRIELTLKYRGTDISENMQITFDKNVGMSV